MLVKKLVLFFLTSAIYLSEICHGNKNSSKEAAGFGYEILQFQFDDLKNSLNEMSRGLSQVKNENNANHKKIAEELEQIKNTIKTTVDSQSSLMKQMLAIVNNTNQNLEENLRHQKECAFLDATGRHRLICDNCPTALTVYCERESFGGGWIVVQQRLDGSVNFTRNWAEYRDGFGTVGKRTEFWLGLEKMHQITNSGSYELVVELKDSTGKYGYARYSDFKVDEEKEKYRITSLGEYSGTIQDQLRYHKDIKFSTFDQDNDESSTNCSLGNNSGGGWWYKKCANCVLNGAFIKNKEGYGIYWAYYSNAASFSRMMIRRK